MKKRGGDEIREAGLDSPAPSSPLLCQDSDMIYTFIKSIE